MKEALSPRQVALAIGVSESSLKRWCDKGLVKVIKTAGGHRRLPVSEVMRFLKESDFELVRPEILGLPSATGRGKYVWDRAVSGVAEALQTGDEDSFRRILFDLYLSGHPVHEILDRGVRDAFALIGERWEHGSVEIYQERRGVEICMRFLHELRGILTPPKPDAPRAMGGTLSGDLYTIPGTAVEIVLRDAGWRAESCGAGNPGETIATAIHDTGPRLVWLSVSWIESFQQFLADVKTIQRAALEVGAALVVGGHALESTILEQVQVTKYCRDLKDLVDFARVLQPDLDRGSGTAPAAAGGNGSGR